MSARPAVQAPDLELEQREAETHYHCDRFELYRARVVSGSSVATSTTRLRELERTATAAADSSLMRVAYAESPLNDTAAPVEPESIPAYDAGAVFVRGSARSAAPLRQGSSDALTARIHVRPDTAPTPAASMARTAPIA
jgi:hypothetical protein